MTIEVLVSRGTSNAAVARLPGLSEGAVRYYLGRMAAGAVEGRGARPLKATRVADAIEDWWAAQEDGAINLAAVHAWLVAKHGCDGSYGTSVQRFWANALRPPRSRSGLGNWSLLVELASKGTEIALSRKNNRRLQLYTRERNE